MDPPSNSQPRSCWTLFLGFAVRIPPHDTGGGPGHGNSSRRRTFLGVLKERMVTRRNTRPAVHLNGLSSTTDTKATGVPAQSLLVPHDWRSSSDPVPVALRLPHGFQFIPVKRCGSPETQPDKISSSGANFSWFWCPQPANSVRCVADADEIFANADKAKASSRNLAFRRARHI
jgi:hypothetical protein